MCNFERRFCCGAIAAGFAPGAEAWPPPSVIVVVVDVFPVVDLVDDDVVDEEAVDTLLQLLLLLCFIVCMQVGQSSGLWCMSDSGDMDMSARIPLSVRKIVSLVNVQSHETLKVGRTHGQLTDQR